MKAIHLSSVFVLAMLASASMAQTVPPAPYSLKAVAGDGAVGLLWATAGDAASYTVQRSTNGTSFSTLATVAQGTARSYEDRNAVNGVKYYYRVFATDSGLNSANSNTALATAAPPHNPDAVRWPLPAIAGAERGDADANTVRYQYGPRYIGSYDFHAGVDLATPEGTEVRPVMAGEVDAIGVWDGTSTGSGNFVRIRHQATPGGEVKYTSYLHLQSVSEDLHVADAANGIAASVVDTDTVLGLSGKSGASWPHLHLTYMVGTSGGSATANAEKRSKNPLEILPHGEPEFSGQFRDGKAEITMRSNLSTVRWVLVKGTLNGEAVERLVDYYTVVDRGEELRNSRSQGGLQLDATSPVDDNGRSAKIQGRFTLKLSAPAAETAFVIDRVELYDAQDQLLFVLDRS